MTSVSALITKGFLCIHPASNNQVAITTKNYRTIGISSLEFRGPQSHPSEHWHHASIPNHKTESQPLHVKKNPERDTSLWDYEQNEGKEDILKFSQKKTLQGKAEDEDSTQVMSQLQKTLFYYYELNCFFLSSRYFGSTHACQKYQSTRSPRPVVIQQYVPSLTANFKAFKIRQLMSLSQSSLPHIQQAKSAFHALRYLISSAKNNTVILWFVKSDTVRSGSLTKGNSQESWKYMRFFGIVVQAIQHKPIFSNKLFCIQKVLHYTFTYFPIKCKAYS